jgi:acetyltransferase-like isoleucine patch superfamily enzyme
MRRMTPRRAFALFWRRMIVLPLARTFPFATGRVWLYRAMGARIGRDVYVGFQVEMDTNHPELIEIGDHVTISHQCMLVTHMATDVDTPLRRLYPERAAPVRIGTGAWLCVRALVLPGVTVGPNAVVGAGAVVTRDVPAATMVAGAPARAVKTLRIAS